MTDDVASPSGPPSLPLIYLTTLLWSTLKKEFDDCCAQSSVAKRRRVSMEEREANAIGRGSAVACARAITARGSDDARRTELVLSHEPWHEHDSCCKYVIT